MVGLARTGDFNIGGGEIMLSSSESDSGSSQIGSNGPKKSISNDSMSERSNERY